MGDFIPAQPVNQNYQSDDQFYDTRNGGGFDNFGQDNLADEINTELDKLLGNGPATQGGRNGAVCLCGSGPRIPHPRQNRVRGHQRRR